MRKDCIINLGFHYSNLEDNYIKKIQKILVSDKNSRVRSAAIGALEIQLSLPDYSLLYALMMYSDEENRKQVFKVVLNLCGVPYGKINQTIVRVENGNLELSLDCVKKF